MKSSETSLGDCRIIELPKTENVKGNLTAVHGSGEIPFDVKRVYYLYDVPGGETRGGHAHKDLRQLIVCVSGSFDVLLDDGAARRTFSLNRPWQGLYIPRMIWREIVNFSTGGICLSLASLSYDRDEYLYEYDEFRALKRGLGLAEAR